MTAKTKRNATPTARKSRAARIVKPVTEKSVDQLVSEIIHHRLNGEPIYSAIEAYERALGHVLVMGPNAEGPGMRKAYMALNKATMRVAETVPNTRTGLAASARWFHEFVAYHDGLANLSEHPALEAWHSTVKKALHDRDGAPDPAFAALDARNMAVGLFNAATAETPPEERKRLEAEYIRQQCRVEQTSPTTPLGLARSLEVFAADAGSAISDEQTAWLRRLVACARALS